MARTVADKIRAVWELELGAMLYGVNKMGRVTGAGGGIVQLALAEPRWARKVDGSEYSQRLFSHKGAEEREQDRGKPRFTRWPEHQGA